MTPEQLQEWTANPLAWMAYHWPDMVIAPHQAEILRSVADTIETFCHSGNTTGKTRVAALVVLWFFTTRFPARVIVSSSSNRQLKNALWPEVTKLIRQAVHPLGIRETHMHLGVVNDETGRPYDDHFVEFFVTTDVENFQGVHEASDVPRVLVLFEEASGVGDEFWDAATSFAHRILVIGNPLKTNNFYYHCCRRGDIPSPDGNGLARRVIHVDAKATPNVKAGLAWKATGCHGPPPIVIPGMLTFGQYVHHLATKHPLWILQRLHGRFDESGDSLMFPVDWLDKAEIMWQTAKLLPRGPFALGVDVAEGGRDLTCWCVLDKFGIVKIITLMTKDTTVIIPKTLELMAEYDVHPSRVAFDRGCGGYQYAQTMRSQGQPVKAISFGGGAFDSKTYMNTRAEMYWRLRNTADPSRWSKVEGSNGDGVVWERFFSYDPNEFMLREELAVPPIMHDGEGRLKMLRKDPMPRSRQPSIKGFLGRSPDRADAVALANYVLRGPSRSCGAVRTTRSMVAKTESETRIEESALTPDEAKKRSEWRASLRDRVLGRKNRP